MKTSSTRSRRPSVRVRVRVRNSPSPFPLTTDPNLHLDPNQATVSGQRALGKALEQSVRGLRADWEREVNVLIDGAKTDVDLAVSAARV